MSARLGWAAGVAAFGVAVVFAALDLWLYAVAALYVPVYLAGRWDRRRDRTVVAGEMARKDARIAALEDELTYRYEAAHTARWADDDRLMPDNGGGYQSPAVLNDRNTGAATPTRGARPAQVRAAATNP